MTQGWKCPSCGKAHAPTVQTCPEPAGLFPNFTPYPGPQPSPYREPYQWHWSPVTCGSASTACDPKIQAWN